MHNYHHFHPFSYGTPNYDSARFDDFSIFIPYVGLNMHPGSGSTELSFVVSIRTAAGTDLDRDITHNSNTHKVNGQDISNIKQYNILCQ